MKPSNSTIQKKQARKKTSRACVHCHKAHMTCDEARPCNRCISRGLANTCVDAPRKKKKYLMDAPGIETELNSFTPKVEQNKDIRHSAPIPEHIQLHNSSLHSQSFPSKPAVIPNEPIAFYTTHLNPKSKFMSSAANSEYSILSDIIKQDGFNSMNMEYSSSNNDTQSPPSVYNHQHSHHQPQRQNHQYAHGTQPRAYEHTHLRDNSTSSAGSTSQSTPIQSHDIYNTYRQGDKEINQYSLGIVQDQLITFPEVMKLIEGRNRMDSDDTPSRNSMLSFTIGITDSASNDTTYSTSSQSPWGLRYKEPEEIYARINRPFSYTPGFHALFSYLKNRFTKVQLVKMAKSISNFRPSFIACTNTLKEEDLIFMEQCFQRTLLEYDKFISISGTPTIVWRRTGQIAYVSEEFCILTGWTREQLLNKVTFIVELMDDISVIEYFDLFSTIAYGDFRGATMTGCTLLTPTEETLKTACMWTLKRDVFGIPMMIIGNFLPILG